MDTETHFSYDGTMTTTQRHNLTTAMMFSAWEQWAWVWFAQANPVSVDSDLTVHLEEVTYA